MNGQMAIHGHCGSEHVLCMAWSFHAVQKETYHSHMHKLPAQARFGV